MDKFLNWNYFLCQLANNALVVVNIRSIAEGELVDLSIYVIYMETLCRMKDMFIGVK